jgi:hypothetical protein
MLSLRDLRVQGVPDELANRMMVAHGSRQLLRMLRGEPEPVELPEPPKPTPAKKPHKRPRHVRVGDRPMVKLPDEVAAIINAVADQFGMLPEDVRGPTRNKPYVYARAVAYKLIRERTWATGDPRHTLLQVATFFGRDHSSVCHAIELFDQYATNPAVAAVYDALRGKGE